MEGAIIVQFEHADWERVINLIDKDHQHRKKMRRKMAKMTGRDPSETKARVGKIVYTILDNYNDVEEYNDFPELDDVLDDIIEDPDYTDDFLKDV